MFNLFFKILQNKYCHAKVLSKRFHFNGDTNGFCLQNQELALFINSAEEKKVNMPYFVVFC